MVAGAGLMRDMVNGETAREWLRAWGTRAFRCGRAQEAMRSALKCAGLCGDRRPVARDGFLEAARTIEAAIRSQGIAAD